MSDASANTTDPMTVGLEGLVGKHILTAVGAGHESVKDWGDEFTDCETLSFTLDGTTYSAVENPIDGYRSSMRYLKITSAIPEYAIPPHEVIGSMRERSEYGDENDVLDFRDVVTGKIVLSVGTENCDDYYPGFVADWLPQNLAANASPKAGDSTQPVSVEPQVDAEDSEQMKRG